MAIKDHYKTLGIATNASVADIKTAYRSLAHKYHPDKNPDNRYAASHFMEIQQAYKVLGDEKARKLYDEERYFAGLSAQKEPMQLTPEWLLTQAKKLSGHMESLDSYTMNHRAVSEYILLLLSDSHLAVLAADSDIQTNRNIIEEVTAAIRKIEYRYYPAIVKRLVVVAGTDQAMLQTIAMAEEERRRRMRGDNYLPVWVIIVTLVLCVLMYLYKK